ncbi:MAG: type VI secretion system tube protein Hcp [Casimicrobium sp.]
MAGNLFLQIGDVKGECAEANHKEWIDVESYSEGLQSSGTAGYGGGAGLGTVSYNDITITCHMEKAIPALMRACADHKHYGEAKLHATKMGGNGNSFNYIEITCKDVVVTGVHFSGMANQIPTVQVSLNFSKIKTMYFMQSGSGGQGSSTEAEWDQKSNKAM